MVKSTSVQDPDVADIILPIEVVQNLVSMFDIRFYLKFVPPLL
jgi:hypothetical protein